ncbi:hypothetical protein A4W74_04580 [Latilactobacillus curvatus]|nr:hypothetical protein [Latilactobacillus curvatus]UTB76001.1 hypothetical protein A4W74_04580 [Latilactobacillus curvatus]
MNKRKAIKYRTGFWIIVISFVIIGWLLCQESGHKSTNKFDFQFKLLNLIFGGRSFSPVQILKTL